MNLSSDLVSQLVKVSGDNEKKTSKETTVYGTVESVEVGGRVYVRLDGSDQLAPTPATTTTDVEAGERVTVMIKDHSATITGNTSSPSARTDTVKDAVNRLDQFDVIIANKVDTEQLIAEIAKIDTLLAEKATIDQLKATEAEIEKLVAEDVTINGLLTAARADIDQIEASYVTTDILEADYATIKELEAAQADIYDLEATYGTFAELTTTRLEANEANIGTLTAEIARVETLQAGYADIEFANIGDAAINNLYAKSGIIEVVESSEGFFTKRLVAVEINGDLIKAGTIQVDRLIVKGDDGNYYSITTDFDSINVSPVEEDTIHGSILVAESVTAEKIRVDDLLAFKATIAGFNLKELEDGTKTKAIYSGVKNSITNTTTGIYMDDTGQLYVGNATDYLKFFKDTDGKWQLDIKASSITLGSGKTVEEAVEEAVESADIQIGARNLIRNSKSLLFEGYYFESTAAASVLGLSELGTFVLGDRSNTEAEVDEIEEYGIAIASEPEVVETEAGSDEYTHQGFVDGMTLHDYHLIKMENAIIKALAGVATARITTISLPAASWSGSGTIYSQAVTMTDVTANSKIDLLPSPEQLNELLLAEISLTAANSDGAITIFALGAAPTSDLELQAMITEVIIPEVSS